MWEPSERYPDPHVVALDPSFLAHGTLATIDVGATLFLVGTLYCARRVWRVVLGGRSVWDRWVVVVISVASLAVVRVWWSGGGYEKGRGSRCRDPRPRGDLSAVRQVVPRGVDTRLP